MNRLAALLLALLCTAALAAQHIEIISLRHRLAEQLLPQLQPFVEPGGTLSGMQDKLFIRASARNQAEIRKLVGELDTPLRRLMISVRQDGEAADERRGGGIDGQVVVQNGRVGVGGTARVYSSERARGERLGAAVQTVDGGRAAIIVGQSVWLPLRQVVLTPAGVVVAESIVQRDLGSGFVALPRLVGERVTVDIMPLNETAGATPGSARIERLSTTLSGPLGEWLPLGGTAASEESSGGGRHWSAGAATSTRRYLLKVEALD